MQVFLPYSDFDKSVKCLDPSRLGNQVYREGKTLISGKWPNHPVSKMWKGYEYALAEYCLAGLRELTRRGRHYQKWYDYFEQKKKEYPNTGLPPFVGKRKFHRSHQSKLVSKNPEYYRNFFPDVPDDLPYQWWNGEEFYTIEK